MICNFYWSFPIDIYSSSRFLIVEAVLYYLESTQSYNWNIKFLFSISYRTSWAAITQFLDQSIKTSRSRLILQSIKDVSRILQKLLTYFNGTIIATSFMSLAFVCPVMFSLILNKSVIELATVKLKTAPVLFRAGSSLQHCQKFQMFLNNYHCILLICTLALLCQCHGHYLFMYCLFCLCN